MAISEVVHVNITAQDAAPSQASFDKIMIAAYHTVGSELIRDYTDAVAFQTDFAAFKNVLAMGNAFFAQSPHPVTLSVGRLTTPRAKLFTLTPVLFNNTTYTVTVNNVDYSYVSDGSATAAEIATGLAALIVGITGVTAANAAGVLTLTGTAGTWYSVETPRTDLFTSVETTDATGIATELSAISNERDDFYGVAAEHQSEAYINAVAAWVLTRRKLYFASTSNSDVAGSGNTDVASDLKASSNNRTNVQYAAGASSDYPEVAWMSKLFVKNPGSVNWNYKQLAGVSSTPVTGTQITNLKAKNATVVRTLGGLVLTFGSKLASGRYIDVQHGIDWLQARIEEALFFLLASNDKIPYTDAGLAQIEGAIRAILQEAVRNNFLADDDNLDVFITPVSQQATLDRAARIVRGVKFTGRLAGAVDEIFVDGSVFP